MSDLARRQTVPAGKEKNYAKSKKKL